MVKVGDEVRLSTIGFERIKGVWSWEEVEEAKHMCITRIKQLGPDLIAIEVDGPLSCYMLTEDCVELL